MLKQWLTIGLAIGLVTAAAWNALPSSRPQISEGQAAPSFMLKNLAGGEQGLPEGEVVLLNFWATWCPPCRQEMPSMAKLYNQLKDEGLKIIAVSVDKDINDLTAFVREYSLPFTVLHDPDARVSHDYGVYRFPETFLIGRAGTVRYHLIGAVEWTHPEVIANIRAMLAERPQD
jgi:DsbE subfamily thiol:disulfide oxidoreductase